MPGRLSARARLGALIEASSAAGQTCCNQGFCGLLITIVQSLSGEWPYSAGGRLGVRWGFLSDLGGFSIERISAYLERILRVSWRIVKDTSISAYLDVSLSYHMYRIWHYVSLRISSVSEEYLTRIWHVSPASAMIQSDTSAIQ